MKSNQVDDNSPSTQRMVGNSNAQSKLMDSSYEGKINWGYTLGYIIVILIGCFHYGYGLCIFGSSLTLYAKMYGWNAGINTDNWSVISVVTLLLGAFLIGLVSHHFLYQGRRFGLYCAAAFNILSLLFISVWQWPEGNKTLALSMLIIGRLVLGFSIGLYSSTCTCFINEISPEVSRARFGCAIQMTIGIGIAVIYGVGVGFNMGPDNMEGKELVEYLTYGFLWRFASAIPSFLAVIQCILLLTFFTLDSPQYYIEQNNDEKAKESLRRVFSEEAVVENKLRKLKEMRDQKDKDATNDLAYSDYVKGFWVGLTIPALQQLTGINVLTMFAPTAFENQGNAEVLSAVLSVFHSVFAAISIVIVNKVGKKVLLLIGSAVIVIGYIVCLITYSDDGSNKAKNWVYNVSTFLIVGIFNLSWGPMTYIFLLII